MPTPWTQFPCRCWKATFGHMAPIGILWQCLKEGIFSDVLWYSCSFNSLRNKMLPLAVRKQGRRFVTSRSLHAEATWRRSLFRSFQVLSRYEMVWWFCTFSSECKAWKICQDDARIALATQRLLLARHGNCPNNPLCPCVGRWSCRVCFFLESLEVAEIEKLLT